MKKVFYFTDALPFLAKEGQAIDKLQRNLKIFREASNNIRLVWHPWSKTEEYLKLNNCTVTDEYLSILNNYRQEGWGDLDETDTYDSAKEVLLSCDAYYGDTSDMVYDAQNAKIPVMLQNIEV
nr:hypothetical protein [uncultured Butyrivibrio sp.]